MSDPDPARRALDANELRLAEPDRPFDLGGRVAFVTGAGSGIGRSSATVLAAHGASVVCADVDQGAAAATVGEIVGRGQPAIAVQVNIAARAEVDAAIERTVSELGRLDILVNAAGISGGDHGLLDADDDEFDRVFAVNVKGVLYACQAAARVMRPGASIVNLASAAHDLAGATNAVYGLSKSALVFITRSIALELAPRRIRVNCVAPGAVLTNMTRRHFMRDGVVDESLRQSWINAMEEFAPLGVVAAAEDIAYAVLYLGSDASRIMTGQTIRPNSGIARPA